MFTNKIKVLILSIIIGGIALFYFSTIKEGYEWEDATSYILHAKNIAQGTNYKNTGYIYNPSRPSYSPRTYPSVFPFLLAPVYKFFGLNLAVLRIECILIFLASFLMIFLAFKDELAFPYLIFLIVLFGLNFSVWFLKDSIISEIPFIFFAYFTFFLVQKTYRSGQPADPSLFNAVLVGLFVCLTCGTRIIGFIFIPSLFVYEIIKFKKLSRFFAVVVGLFVLFVLIETVFFRGDFSYFDQFYIKFSNICWLAKLYLRSLFDFWRNGYSKIFGWLLFISISGLVVIGYLEKIKNKMTLREIFLILYLACIIIWPSYQGKRFLLPIIPLYLFYMFAGFEKIKFSQSKKIKYLLLAVLVGAIFFSYISWYLKANFTSIRQGFAKNKATALFDYIKKATDKNDVFIFRKPRVLALFAERSASVYHKPKSDGELWDYFNKIGADYIVTGPFDEPFFQFFVEKFKNNLKEVYANPAFKVYRIIKFGSN